MQDLGPFVFLLALGLARLLPQGCTWLRHPQAPERFAAPSPGPWRLPPRLSKTLASAPTPVQRLPLKCQQKRPGRWDFFPSTELAWPCLLTCCTLERPPQSSFSREHKLWPSQTYSASLTSEVVVTGGSMQGGSAREQEGSSLATGWAGHPSSFPAELLFPHLRRTCWASDHAPLPWVWPSPPQRVQPSSGMLCMTVPDPAMPDSLAEEPPVLGALRGANYTLIYLDKWKVGLQLVTWFLSLQGRASCCLLHRQCLSPLI